MIDILSIDNSVRPEDWGGLKGQEWVFWMGSRGDSISLFLSFPSLWELSCISRESLIMAGNVRPTDPFIKGTTPLSCDSRAQLLWKRQEDPIKLPWILLHQPGLCHYFCFRTTHLVEAFFLRKSIYPPEFSPTREWERRGLMEVGVARQEEYFSSGDWSPPPMACTTTSLW